MKRTHTSIAFALGLALAGFGVHAQTNTQADPTSPSRAQTTQTPSGGHSQQSTLADEEQRFLENAIQGSHAEIVGSQLALEKTENADVTAFAQKMIDDHSKMAKEAEALARNKGMTPPSGPSVMQSTEITALKALSGGAFDAMYVNRIGVASHEATVKLFEEAIQKAQDPDVKAMATKTLPKLQEHLKMAKALNAKQDNE